jgi:hypothetical protein
MKIPGQECRRCGRRHQTWRAAARCHWPSASWIAGRVPFPGPCFAVLSRCPGGLTITLWHSLDNAREAKATIDRTGCGGRCQPGNHVLVALGAQPLAVA